MVGEVPEFTSRVHWGYQEYAQVLGETLPADQSPLIAPVGLAFLLIWEEAYGIWEKLFLKDRLHPSPHGTYLIGCVLYATLYSRMPLTGIAKQSDDTTPCKPDTEGRGSWAMESKQKNQQKRAPSVWLNKQPHNTIKYTCRQESFHGPLPSITNRGVLSVSRTFLCHRAELHSYVQYFQSRSVRITGVILHRHHLFLVLDVLKTIKVSSIVSDHLKFKRMVSPK